MGTASVSDASLFETFALDLQASEGMSVHFEIVSFKMAGRDFANSRSIHAMLYRPGATEQTTANPNGNLTVAEITLSTDPITQLEARGIFDGQYFNTRPDQVTVLLPDHRDDLQAAINATHYITESA
jgi:hypothetical protein